MNVCVIGNGPSATKHKNGNFIDQCDKVIRMGNFQVEGYEEFIGSKTDIYISRWKKLEANFSRVNKLSIWLAYPEPPHNWCSHYTQEESVIRNNLAIRDLSVTYTPPEIEEAYKDIYKPYNNILANSSDARCGFNIPDTGMVAIDMARCLFNGSKIYTTGIDCYFLGSDYYYNRGVKVGVDYMNASPLLQQYIIFKKLIATKKITVL